LPGNSSGTRQLFDEVLDLITLVDDHVPLVLLDYVLDFTGLVTRHDRKTVPLATNALVLSEGHQHASLAPACLPAFTLEFELLLGSGPVGALVESGALIVHRPHQGFVPSLPLEPLLHASGSYAAVPERSRERLPLIALPHHALEGRGQSAPQTAAPVSAHSTSPRPDNARRADQSRVVAELPLVSPRAVDHYLAVVG
jgi:hypothetical protein